MRKSMTILAALSGLLLFSGCTALNVAGVKPAQEVKKDSRVGEELLKAFFKNDAELFLSQLPGEVRANFGKKDFEQTRKGMTEKLGTPVEYSYLLNLEHPFAAISVWKLKFRRENPENGKVFTQEILFRAAYTTAQGKPVLLSFNFL